MNHRSLRLVIGTTLILLSGVFISAAAESEDAAKVIDQIMDLSGATDMVNAFPAMVDQQIGSQLGQFEGEDADFFRETMQAAFDPQQFHSAIKGLLLENYDAKHAKATMDWYESELGRKVREGDAKTQTPTAQQELMEFSQSLQETPPSPARVEFVQRLDAATRASEMSLKVMMAMMRGMMGGLAALDVGDAPTPGEVDSQLEEQAIQLAPMIQNQTLFTLLFSTTSLTDAETAVYLAHAESDAGRWFNELMGAGLVGAMLRAGDALGAHVTAFMQDKKKSLPPEKLKELRESALGNGRDFGRATKQSSCMDEAFKKRNECRDLTCSMEAELFLEGCLDTSQKEASLCADAPSEDNLANTIYWRMARCEEYKAPTSACNRLMATLQEHCAAPRTEV